MEAPVCIPTRKRGNEEAEYRLDALLAMEAPVCSGSHGPPWEPIPRLNIGKRLMLPWKPWYAFPRGSVGTRKPNTGRMPFSLWKPQYALVPTVLRGNPYRG